MLTNTDNTACIEYLNGEKGNKMKMKNLIFHSPTYWINAVVVDVQLILKK